MTKQEEIEQAKKVLRDALELVETYPILNNIEEIEYETIESGEEVLGHLPKTYRLTLELEIPEIVEA